MSKILALWAVPRSTSTAFEWMMRQRRDLSCWHEPFGKPWYQGDDRKWPRFEPGVSPQTPGLTFDSVWQSLRRDAETRAVFIKDFPHYIEHLWNEEFFDCFTHSFLIRDPAKMLNSMHRKWPEFLIEETGYIQQRLLFDKLHEQYQTVPPVIDSDDLLENPRGIVKAYCEAVGIEFIESALSWDPGARDEVSWYDKGSWHDNLAKSDGLKPQTVKPVDVAALPEKVQEIYRRVLPEYQHLYQYRLKV